MKVRILLLPACLLLMISALPSEAAESIIVGKVEVSQVKLPEIEVPSLGYVELRFLLRNLSPKETQRLTLRYPQMVSGAAAAMGYSRQGPILREVRKTLVLAPDTLTTVSLFFPPYGLPPSSALIASSGTDRGMLDILSPGCFLYGNRFSYGSASSPPVIACGPRFDAMNFASILFPEIRSERPNGTSAPPEEKHDLDEIRRAGVVPMKRAPFFSSWLSGAAYSAMILESETLLKLPPEQLRYLADWVSTGGVLLVPDMTGPKVRKLLLGARGAETGVPTEGFGRIMGGLGSDPKSILRAVRTAASAGSDPRSSLLRGPKDPLPVFDEARKPLFGLDFLFLLLFALAAGPGLSWISKRRGNALSILWVAPCLAILVSGLVVGITIARDGISPIIRTRGLSLLDQQAHHVFSAGILSIFPPSSLAGKLEVPPDTEMILWADPQLQWKDRSISLDWSTRQSISGWVVAKSPTRFLWRGLDTTPLRLILRRTDEGMEAVNGLKTTIRSLRLRAWDGTLWKGGKAAPGSVLSLSREEGDHGDTISGREAFKAIWNSSPKEIFSDRLPPAPGSYLALTTSSPFIDPGLEHFREKEGEGLILGLLEPEAGRGSR